MGRLLLGAGLFVAPSASAAVPPQSPVLPGIGPNSRRDTMDPAVAPWSAVARLNVPGVSRCTATLIAPRLALTAAHCVVSRRLGGLVPPSAVHVVAGYRDGQFAAHSVALAVAVAPGYDSGRQAATGGADVALVTLATPVIAAAAALPIADTRPGAAVAVGGYSQDREERITADTACRITGAARDGEGRPLLVHDCAATRGTSGGALLSGAGGAWHVAGIEVGAFDARPGGVAIPAAAIHAFFGLPLSVAD